MIDFEKEHPWILLERLVDVILFYVPGCIVEIGIGASTKILTGFGVKVYTCDTSQSKCDWARDLPNCEVFNGKSSAFMKQFDDKPSFVLIDGCHNSKVVMYEVDFFLSKLNTGGVIFIHDTCPWESTYIRKMTTKNKEPDTYKVRKELEKRTDIEVFTWPYTASYCGLTMILKKDMSQPFYRR